MNALSRLWESKRYVVCDAEVSRETPAWRAAEDIRPYIVVACAVSLASA